jgi:hypothetical protein
MRNSVERPQDVSAGTGLESRCGDFVVFYTTNRCQAAFPIAHETRFARLQKRFTPPAYGNAHLLSLQGD